MTQLQALALTLAIEGIVAAGLLWLWDAKRPPVFLPLVAVVLAASAITHPLAWTANESWLRALPFWTRAAIIECAVVLAEALIIAGASRRVPDGRLRAWQAMVLSLAANGTSFAYGLLRLS